MTQNGATYTWDSENRLIEVSGLGSSGLAAVVSYTYDGTHRRVTKRTAVSGTVTEKTHYIYDSWNVIEEYANTDTTPAFKLTTFALAKTLTWGTDLSGKREEPSAQVPARDKQAEEDLWQRHKAECGV